MTKALVFACAVLILAPFQNAVRAAADGLDRVVGMRPLEPVLAADPVEQGGGKAAELRSIMNRITLPPGFKISLFAIVPGARHMAVSGRGGSVFVGTRRSVVWLVADRDANGRAEEVRRLAPGLRLTLPNGVCLSPEGHLYVAEINRLLIFPKADALLEAGRALVGLVRPTLVPRGEASPGHGARTCVIGPDDRIYVTLGQPHNVTPRAKLELYEASGVGGIVAMDRWDGSNLEVYARGIRNSVGMAFNPANGELWFTDNQVDGMGDLIPPGELNRATGPGQHFGFPWYGGGDTRTRAYKNDAPPDGLVFPAVAMDAHAADLGMMFYRGERFPEKYRGGIFSAQHGSWNRTTPIGARVMFTALNPDGSAGETEVFAAGWLDEKTGTYRGRPVDVVGYLDGSILVSDDHAGAIYRIRYDGEN